MNFLKLPEPRLTVVLHGDGTMTCLPTRLDRSHLRDVTPVGAASRVYLDEATGALHRSAEYYNQKMAGREASKQN